MALDENNDLTDIYKYLKYYNISSGLLSMAAGCPLYIENVFYCVTSLLREFHPGFSGAQCATKSSTKSLGIILPLAHFMNSIPTFLLKRRLLLNAVN